MHDDDKRPTRTPVLSRRQFFGVSAAIGCVVLVPPTSAATSVVEPPISQASHVSICHGSGNARLCFPSLERAL